MIFKIIYRTFKVIFYAIALWLLFVALLLGITIKYILTGDADKENAFEKWCNKGIDRLIPKY